MKKREDRIGLRETEEWNGREKEKEKMKQILNVFLPIIIALSIPLNVEARGQKLTYQKQQRKPVLSMGRNTTYRRN